MYVFPLKRSKHAPVPKEIEFYMDKLINEPFVILPDPNLSWKLGVYAKELRERGILHLSSDIKLNEPIAVLKINNALRPNSVKKRKGKTIEYIFQDTLLPKIDLPDLDIY